ncbi:MAG: hypothetical protein ACXWH7_00870, partial [Thermoanaerobaculia bacterium]
MRADFKMPLPKSVLCSACKKTYPEGWKRCPYCGHDELRLKQTRQAARYMDKKVREFEQRTGKSPKEQRPQQQQQPREGQRQRDRQRQGPPKP